MASGKEDIQSATAAEPTIEDQKDYEVVRTGETASLDDLGMNQGGSVLARWRQSDVVERYTYYLFIGANNGIGPYQYCALLFQNLIYQAGFNPNVLPLGSEPCGDDTSVPCHVFWGNGTKDYNAVVLIGSGITFAIQTVIFILLGATADYGGWAPWILRTSATLYSLISLSMLAVKNPEDWPSAMALYVIINILFWIALTFGIALFPRLSEDHMKVVKATFEEKEGRPMTDSEYNARLDLAGARTMNYAWAWNSFVFAAAGAIAVGVLKGIGAEDSVEQNNWGYSLCVVVAGAETLVLSIPFYFLQHKRPGKQVPAGSNIVATGLTNYARTLMKAPKLSQTFFYLALYFVMADGQNTLLTQLSLVASSVVSFSVVDNTYFLIVQGVSAGLGPFIIVWIQKKLGFRTKTMLHLSNLACVLLCGWGLAGTWTNVVGLHHTWEFWAVNGLAGVTTGTQWAYSLAFLGELVPRGEENQFFSLSGIISKGGAWIGPVVSSAIIDRTQSQYPSFGFLGLLIGVPGLLVFFVDEDKAKIQCEQYLAGKEKERENCVRYKIVK